jgi:hypothetical protein
MICNISYDNKRQEFEINKHVGQSFSIWESIRMGGSGSQKLIIVEADEVFHPYLKQRNSTKYCNIELRPNGIGLRFRFKLEAIGWFVPFQNLEYEWTEKTLDLKDAETGHFMKLRPSYRSTMNLRFMKKLAELAGR